VTWRENIRPNAHIAAISGGLFVETNWFDSMTPKGVSNSQIQVTMSHCS
jgi:hypothetical protein